MTEIMRQITSRKLAWRRRLASLPVGEKLRMLEEMVEAAKTISATRPPKPAVAITTTRLAQNRLDSR
jgi:hypothetical protein